MKKTQSSAQDIKKRRDALLFILLDFKKKGLEPSREQLLQFLSRKGYKIDLSTLYRDRCALNMENSFVKDLTFLPNYSAYMEDMWEDMEIVRRWCLEKIHDMWDSKNPHLMFQVGKLLHENVKTKIDFLNGGVLSLSISLLTKEVKKIKEENQALKNNNQLFEKT